jgi:hypothetical protein
MMLVTAITTLMNLHASKTVNLLFQYDGWRTPINIFFADAYAVTFDDQVQFCPLAID